MVCEGKEESMITGSGRIHFKQRKQFLKICEIYKNNLNQKLGTSWSINKCPVLGR